MEYQLAEQRRQFARKFGQIVLQSSAALSGLAFAGTIDESTHSGGTSCSRYPSSTAGRKQGKRAFRKQENAKSSGLLSFTSHFLLTLRHLSIIARDATRKDLSAHQRRCSQFCQSLMISIPRRRRRSNLPKSSITDSLFLSGYLM